MKNVVIKFLFILFFIFIFLLLYKNISFGAIVDTPFIQNGCPDDVVQAVLNCSYYQNGLTNSGNHFSGFFIWDYGKYENTYRALLFDDGFTIYFNENDYISEHSESDSNFYLIGISKSNYNVIDYGYINFNYSEDMTLTNYFFTGVNSNLYINNVLQELTIPISEDFYLANTSPSYDFLQILSKQFSSNYYNSYHAYICLESNGYNKGQWFQMNKEYATLNNDEFIFYYNLFENGNYHIRLIDDNSGLYLFDDYIEVYNLLYDITLDPYTETDKPIIAKTNEFSYGSSYLVYFSTDKEEWTALNNSRVEPEENNSTVYGTNYYWTRIFKNNTYYFKFIKFIETIENGHIVNAETENYYVTIIVDNITIEDYMSDDYIFKPIISLNFNNETQSFIIRTQSILLDKALNLKCFYTTDFENTDITSWLEMDIDFENNIYMNTSDAYFYFEIPIINASNTNYHIAFYNYFSKKSSDIILYEFIYNDARDFIENNLDVHLGLSIQLNDFLKSIEDRLGILGLPVQVIRSFCVKISSIKEEEPIITIPELHEPIGNYKILDSVSYNFNSILTNNTTIFIHEFYLTIVDMFFIYLLLIYLINTLKSFISKE